MGDHPPDISARRPGRLTWPLRIAGGLLLALGFIGMFVPLLPTVILWILAAICFGRSDPAIQAWIFGHHRFGATVEGFVRRGILSRTSKRGAFIGLSVSYVVALLTLPRWELKLAVLAILLGVAVYIATRPEG